MNIIPKRDKILVRADKRRDMTEGGIHLPEDSEAERDAVAYGTVLAVGPGARLYNGEIVAPDVKVGERVCFLKYSGSRVDERDKTILLMTEDDIIARIE